MQTSKALRIGLGYTNKLESDAANAQGLDQYQQTIRRDIHYSSAAHSTGNWCNRYKTLLVLTIER